MTYGSKHDYEVGRNEVIMLTQEHKHDDEKWTGCNHADKDINEFEIK